MKSTQKQAEPISEMCRPQNRDARIRREVLRIEIYVLIWLAISAFVCCWGGGVFDLPAIDQVLGL